MGYTHYWRRPAEIDAKVFRCIVADFQSLLPELEKTGVLLAGPAGRDRPIINQECIAFNGPINCGHKEYELHLPWPAPGAGGVFSDGDPVAGKWYAGDLLKTRFCPGDCSYESFIFPRVIDRDKYDPPKGDGLYFCFCKTAFRPYDLAVTSFLLIAKHHLGSSITITTDGEDAHWFDAKLLCQLSLNYGLEYIINDRRSLSKRL